jgi:KDO transferase-3
MFNSLRKIRKAMRKRFAAPGMKQVARLDPRFALGQKDQEGNREILWGKRRVGVARSPSALHKIQRGKIYILANGPSLAELDITQLGIHKSMGLNGSIVKYRDTAILPDFYVISDPSFMKKRFSLVREVLQTGVKCFFPYHALCDIAIQDVRLLDNENIFLYHNINDNYDQPILDDGALIEQLKLEKDFFLPKDINRLVGFSYDICKGTFGGRTVAFQGVQVAAYLGFSQIYLAGMDLGAPKVGPLRFYEDNTNKAMRKSRLDQNYEKIIEPAFECAVLACRNRDIHIYNLSAQSRLPNSVMEKISFAQSLQ